MRRPLSFVLFALVMPVAAHAQDAPKPADAAEAKADAVGLDRVVVTGTSQAKSKMRSSVSVTDVDQEQVSNLGARSEAEVLKLIPGIRAESSAGPGGNSNIAVRGRVAVTPVQSQDPLALAFEISGRLGGDKRRGVVRLRSEMSHGGRVTVS